MAFSKLLRATWLSLILAASAAQAQTTAFTYQGQLKSGGSATSGNYDFIFRLFDAASGGTLLGTVNQTLPVSRGLFTASLDFANQFPTANRWLEISVRVTGGGSYTLLSPRQPITPAPYALGLDLPFHGVSAFAGNVFSVTANNGIAISGTGVGGGVYGESDSGAGVEGVNNLGGGAVFAGVHGVGAAPGGFGVTGQAETGTDAVGVYGSANEGTGVSGVSGSGTGVTGSSQTGAGVYGINGNSVAAEFAGVVGKSFMANGNGVAGFADDGVNAYAVYGQAAAGYAGFFNGNVHINGNLSKSSGSFKIDHPLDPANKYLYHSFVESPDMKNIYDGIVTTDRDGFATVTLPDWFQALNCDFRYQLTILDEGNSAEFVQAKIVSGIKENRFTLRTSAPQTTVCWLVTGIRQDPWANAHRIPVEQQKPALEQGLYLHPELYGEPAEMGMQTAKTRAAAQDSASPDVRAALPDSGAPQGPVSRPD